MMRGAEELQARIIRAVIVVGLLVAMGSLLWVYADQHGADRVQRQWDKERLAQAERKADQLDVVLGVQQSIQQSIDDAREDRYENESRIARLYDAAVDSMRNRPEVRASGPTGIPAPSGAGAVGCTGAGLARPDAGFLAGYAADAARLQSELGQCRASYDAAKARLDELAKGGR